MYSVHTAHIDQKRRVKTNKLLKVKAYTTNSPLYTFNRHTFFSRFDVGGVDISAFRILLQGLLVMVEKINNFARCGLFMHSKHRPLVFVVWSFMFLGSCTEFVQSESQGTCFQCDSCFHDKFWSQQAVCNFKTV